MPALPPRIAARPAWGRGAWPLGTSVVAQAAALATFAATASGAVAARVHGRMLGIGLATAAAVLLVAAAFELARALIGGARRVAAGAAAVALGVVAAQLVALVGYASALGRPGAAGGPPPLASTASTAATVGWSVVAGALAIAAVRGRPRPPLDLGADRARAAAALARIGGALGILVALAGAGVLVAVAVFVKKTDDPTGLAVVVALAQTIALGVLAWGWLAVPAAGAPRALLVIAAATTVVYLAIAGVQLVEVVRVLTGRETVGTLGVDGRAALPAALPVAVPAILGAAWTSAVLAIRTIASRAAVEGPAGRVGLEPVTRGAVVVIGSQAAILGVLAYLSAGGLVTRNEVLTGGTLVGALSIASLSSISRAVRAVGAALG